MRKLTLTAGPGKGQTIHLPCRSRIPAFTLFAVLIAAVLAPQPTSGQEKTKAPLLKLDDALVAGGITWSPDGKVLTVPVKRLFNAEGKVIDPKPKNWNSLKDVH